MNPSLVILILSWFFLYVNKYEQLSSDLLHKSTDLKDVSGQAGNQTALHAVSATRRRFAPPSLPHSRVSSLRFTHSSVWSFTASGLLPFTLISMTFPTVKYKGRAKPDRPIKNKTIFFTCILISSCK